MSCDDDGTVADVLSHLDEVPSRKGLNLVSGHIVATAQTGQSRGNGSFSR